MGRTKLPASHDKLLFTPGPLTTSLSVKQAMLHDEGSWHYDFRELVRELTDRLLGLAGTSREKGFEAILMQGSGTFGVESVIGSVIPPNGCLLVLSNGAYGERIAAMCGPLKIDHIVARCPEDQTPSLPELERHLRENPGITHVAVIHCETTTGIINPIAEIGQAVKAAGKVYIVDAMSSFGGMPIPVASWGIDFLISSANKCIEGVPGFSFILAKRDELQKTSGWARSLSLDLLGQWNGFQKNGQFRYTPPTHSVLAFSQALDELELEGGIEGRARRYQHNHKTLVDGMKALGFRPVLHPDVQGFIITSFFFPGDEHFAFDSFYRALVEKGMIIYPGKLTQVDCFRVANIGRLVEADIIALLSAIERTLKELRIQV
jgi:2-aminoethylphosphonate-pyruvate transaminase